jgi:hypothetical protein
VCGGIERIGHTEDLGRLCLNTNMQKIVFRKYGGTDVLESIESPIPEVKHNHVVVQVKATSINPLDWKVRVT